MAAGILAVLVFGDSVLVPAAAAATATTAVNEACPRTVLGPNFRSHETERGNAKNGNVVSERRKTSDVSVSEAPAIAAPDPGLGPGPGRGLDPGSVTTTTGLSKETGLGNTAVSKTITTMSNRGTMCKDRDRRLLLPGNIQNTK